jgi:ABC-type multidrug transport system ATPase subunit
MEGSEKERQERVNELIQKLSLFRCKNLPVKRLSSGERKCAALAAELVSDRKLVFLDDPTSNLSHQMSCRIVKLLNELAVKEQRTIISTYTHANEKTFEQFDQILLLARGQTVYFNKASQAKEYFGNLGYQCPDVCDQVPYYMSMFSKESIEEDCEDEGVVDKYKIDNEYSQLIQYFNSQY